VGDVDEEVTAAVDLAETVLASGLAARWKVASAPGAEEDQAHGACVVMKLSRE
jgi:hypothetical protein